MQNGGYLKILDELHEGAYLVDRLRQITYWNKAAEEITGFIAAEVIGTMCLDNLLVHVDKNGKELCLKSCPLAATMADGQTRSANEFLRNKSGKRVPVHIKTVALRDNSGSIIGGLELFTRIQPPQAMQWKSLSLGEEDFAHSLTGLPNRRYLEHELNMDLHEQAEINSRFGILLIGIDSMTELNAHYGNSMGDRLMCAIAATLAAGIRPFDTLGHWHEDIFMGIFTVPGVSELLQIGQELQALAGTAFIMGNEGRISATVSCGGTQALLRDTVADMVQRAEAALARCKKLGGNLCILELDHEWLK